MEFHQIATAIIIIVILAIIVVIFKSLENTNNTLKQKLKRLEEQGIERELAKTNTISKYSKLDDENRTLQFKHEVALKAIRKLVNNPIACIKIKNDLTDNTLTEPTLRLAAKAEGNKYVAFLYNGGEDVTDKVVLMLSDTDSLEDLLKHV